jgi:hypothetical protein
MGLKQHDNQSPPSLAQPLYVELCKHKPYARADRIHDSAEPRTPTGDQPCQSMENKILLRRTLQERKRPTRAPMCTGSLRGQRGRHGGGGETGPARSDLGVTDGMRLKMARSSSTRSHIQRRYCLRERDEERAEGRLPRGGCVRTMRVLSTRFCGQAFGQDVPP